MQPDSIVEAVREKLRRSEREQTKYVVDAVREKLRRRSERGQTKYGQTMDREDLSVLQWLQHAQEELIDGAVYLEKLIMLIGDQQTISFNHLGG